MVKDKIEATGAKYISCDNYDIQMNLKQEDANRIGKDIAFSMEILVNTTLAMGEAISSSLAYKEQAGKIAAGFRACGGPNMAADKILNTIAK